MSRILVIDDDPTFRKLMRGVLERDGHTVLDADSGEAGLVVFRREMPDLVVTDIFMPGIGGVETIERIRQERPGVKIIAMSGRDGLAAATLLPDGSGADRGLEKPFRRAELIETVGQLLGDGSE